MTTATKITVEQLPPRGAAWSDVEAFCQLIAGPGGDDRPIDELARIANRVESSLRAVPINDLLTATYFYWRRARWNDEADAEDMRAIRGAIEELRRRLTK